MVTRPRRVYELPTTTGVSSNDFIIIEKNSGNTYTTSKLSGLNLRKAIVQGPYANDTIANSNSVALGELYYTEDGTVRVRIS